mgnify:CR=1 FL=1
MGPQNFVAMGGKSTFPPNVFTLAVVVLTPGESRTAAQPSPLALPSFC